MMELTGGSTLSASKGISLSSTEADIPQDKQVSTVLHRHSTLGEVCSELIPLGIGGAIFSCVGIWVMEAINSPTNPLLVLGGMTVSFYLGGVGIFSSLDKAEYLGNTMNTLGISDKKKRKAFARAVKKLPKDQEITFVSDPDEKGNVSIWRLKNKQFSLLGVRNAGEDWDHTLNSTVEVYSLQEEAADLLALQ